MTVITPAMSKAASVSTGLSGQRRLLSCVIVLLAVHWSELVRGLDEPIRILELGKLLVVVVVV